MKLRIDALDTLFFRDGKPFTGGEEAWANMLFPPLPSVLYGALHSAFLAEQIRRWKKATAIKTLTIKAVALQKDDGSLLFPAPLDYVKRKGKKDNNGKGLLLQEWLPSIISSCSVNKLLSNDLDIVVEPLEQGLLDSHALSAYLQNKQDDIRYEVLSQYVVPEPKTGIQRNNVSHAAQDQMLYRIEMKRSLLSLFVEYEGLSLPNRGMLRLGGESKAAAYKPSSAGLPPKPTLTGKRFKLYFATPAIFKQGWRPNWLKQMNETTFQGRYEQLELRLVTAIIGKPLFVGGFDMEQRRPKPMRKAVPAGSVYIFELLQGTIQEAVDLFHGKTISDSGEISTVSSDQKQGFGWTFVGGIL